MKAAEAVNSSRKYGIVAHKKYKITVCADGFVSIVEDMNKRRLNAAFLCHSVEDIYTAIQLVEKLCSLHRCDHGGVTGTTLEPKINDWPMGGCSSLGEMYDLADRFREAEYTLNKTFRDSFCNGNF